MGLKDEIVSVWQPRWEKLNEDPFEHDSEDYFNNDYDDDGKYDAWAKLFKVFICIFVT
ncbi:MAG: hypothetical protein IJZ87_01770 [Bacteroidales bacterium]|nr:hypothetical protein [Bacteroidales bacterium]